MSPLYRIYCQIFKEYLIPSRYVASKYDDLWYFGIITEVNTEEGDVTVQFMHPSGPSPSFHWPKQEDICPVPIPQVLAMRFKHYC